MRGSWGDFARLCPKEGVGGDLLQPALVPRHRGVCVAGRGRQCSRRRRVPRGARVGKRRQEGSWMGEQRPPFYLCLGSLSQVRGSKRGKWRSSLSTPSPSIPGLRFARLGTESRSTGSDRSAVDWSSPGSGEKFRELCRLLCVRREKLRPGTWDAGQEGPVAAGAVSSCVGGGGGGSLGVGEDRVGSMTLGGLRKTWGLSVWRGGCLNPWTLG